MMPAPAGWRAVYICEARIRPGDPIPPAGERPPIDVRQIVAWGAFRDDVEGMTYVHALVWDFDGLEDIDGFGGRDCELVRVLSPTDEDDPAEIAAEIFEARRRIALERATT